MELNKRFELNKKFKLNAYSSDLLNLSLIFFPLKKSYMIGGIHFNRILWKLIWKHKGCKNWQLSKVLTML